ncbi:Na+/H+ antiporter [Caulobacter sp. D4A]|uniref:Na+/H+ antiporter n=1 Tax=unclassified Caulobacter TaxID=2648921 RepID=UPI000D732237|nr:MULTISPECIES: Na+/H+ antiporter [unclassified Caulobacter]PXA72837.1 Na+/H+ antiporter [Caulobacter sp. D4A]PXA86802.1 Na+/H+ antiporter [Caulobacter sp. D5]
METVEIVLALLAAVVLSGAAARFLPLAVPAPLVQIGLGALIALVTKTPVSLDPHLFFLLFLPPLLFLDGWRIPKDEFFKDLPVILELALGLVVLTVVGAGFLIHWMIPAMPLAVAFALAAVISPTDPIAVSAIAQRVPIPKRLMHILEGESLLNDASGLVCLRFAIAAALTGSFVLHEAVLNFAWVALAGIVVGVLTTLVVTTLNAWLSRAGAEDAGPQTLISLLIPFAAYLLAERVHASGILAAVAAGVAMSFSEVARQTVAATRVRRNMVWDTLQFTANGVIFVLLGEQLPSILAGAVETVQTTGHHEPWWLGVYVVAITLSLGALRFAWVWGSLKLTLLRAKRRGDERSSPDWKIIAATACAGARGAITLAGVLTLPLVTASGEAFPARDLAIFLAAGVIVLSLLISATALPLLMKNLQLPPDTAGQEQAERAREALAIAAVQAVEQMQAASPHASDADFQTASARVVDIYRDRLDGLAQTGEAAVAAHRGRGFEKEVRLVALQAERKALHGLIRQRAVAGEAQTRLMREIDLAEARLKV